MILCVFKLQPSHLLLASIMYDPEAPWMGTEFVEKVVSAIQEPQPPAVRVVTWKQIRTELKNIVIEYYNKYHEPVKAQDVWAQLTRQTSIIDITLDYKLLVILLNNMGEFHKTNS